MPTDRALSDIDISDRISSKLGELEINGVRQLYSRLLHEANALRTFLRLSPDDFSELRQKVETVVRDEYPEDLLPQIHPQVNKRGVAVHRLNDPTRPRFPRPHRG